MVRVGVMKRLLTRRHLALAVAIIALVGLGAASLWRVWPPSDAIAAEPRIAAERPAPAHVERVQLSGPSASQPVPVVLPQRQAVTDYVEVTGNAAAVNQVKLLARVEGFLETIHFEDGQLVKKGDRLFSIQQAPYKQQLDQARAQVTLQEAALAHAKTELGRYAALFKEHAAPQTEVDHWNFQRQSAAAQLESAKAQVAIAEVNLGYTEIRAPFDGIVGKHLVDPGNVVGGTQPAALADVTQLDPIYVVANLSEQTVLKVRQNLGQNRLTLADLHKVPVEIGLSDEQGYSHSGTIEYVAPALDPGTGTLLVRGILANPNHTLLPGFFVRIRLPTGKVDRNALLIPDRALQTDQGGTYLLVVDKDGVVKQRYVQLGPVMGALHVVTSGLTPEDRVVVGDLWRASPGTKVTPQLTAVSGTAGSGAPQQ
jgi:RND family efflux transporter MFP subunit